MVVAAHSTPAMTPNASPSSETPADPKPSAKAITMPPNAIQTPHHWRRFSRSLGTSQCNPSAVRIGDRYTKTTMRDAPVKASPAKMNTNSPANRAPASNPGPSVASRWNRLIDRSRVQPNSSIAAISDRSPPCITSEMPGAASLATTWVNPQQKHSTTMMVAARASTGRRAGEGAGTTRRRGDEGEGAGYVSPMAARSCGRRDLRNSHPPGYAALRHLLQGAGALGSGPAATMEKAPGDPGPWCCVAALLRCCVLGQALVRRRAANATPTRPTASST